MLLWKTRSIIWCVHPFRVLLSKGMNTLFIRQFDSIGTKHFYPNKVFLGDDTVILALSIWSNNTKHPLLFLCSESVVLIMKKKCFFFCSQQICIMSMGCRWAARYYQNFWSSCTLTLLLSPYSKKILIFGVGKFFIWCVLCPIKE